MGLNPWYPPLLKTAFKQSKNLLMCSSSWLIAFCKTIIFTTGLCSFCYIAYYSIMSCLLRITQTHSITIFKCSLKNIFSLSFNSFLCVGFYFFTVCCFLKLNCALFLGFYLMFIWCYCFSCMLFFFVGFVNKVVLCCTSLFKLLNKK